MIEVLTGVAAARVPEAVFFPFDDGNVPFAAGLRLRMIPGKQVGRPNPIVLPHGRPGTPDDARARFYGTVIPFEDGLRMWYLGRSALDDSRKDGRGLRVCYATSRDGVHWEKPELGLVEIRGSRRHNVVDLRGGRADVTALPIIHDPADPNASRRFKAVFESPEYDNRFAVAYSPDGLRWTESPHNPVGPILEQTGLIRFRDCYYVNGQGGDHFHGAPRRLITFASYDFEHWLETPCLGFRRDSEPPRAVSTPATTGEEVHLGAGLWDRGNVILGVTDLWHGHPSGDRARTVQDLGLVITHDALHYREPVPDFTLVPAAGELEAPPNRGDTLSHGQGMANVGERTLLWYEIWLHGEIRLASWDRDRLGYYEPSGQMGAGEPQCVTCPFRPRNGAPRVFVNADGLSGEGTLVVEVLDEQFRPLPGYSGADALPLRGSGLRVPVLWKGREALRGVRGPIRLRVRFEGAGRSAVRLFAMYVTG